MVFGKKQKYHNTFASGRGIMLRERRKKMPIILFALLCLVLVIIIPD